MLSGLAGLVLWLYSSRSTAPENSGVTASLQVGHNGALPSHSSDSGPGAPAPVAADTTSLLPTAASSPNAPLAQNVAGVPRQSLVIPVDPDGNAELAATARMYGAHASLRTPEVADPDSVINKRILATMVAKAITQTATPPPDAKNQE